MMCVCVPVWRVPFTSLHGICIWMRELFRDSVVRKKWKMKREKKKGKEHIGYTQRECKVDRNGGGAE